MEDNPRREEVLAMIQRLREGNLTREDMARLYQIQREMHPDGLPAADMPLPLRLRPSCNIDFTRIPEIIPMYVENLDLSGQLEQFTQEPFRPGQEYYRVTTTMNRRRHVYYYFSIDGLQGWLTNNEQTPRCRHPILQNVSIAQGDIKRFTYTGPPTVPPIVVVGGRKFKKISKRLRQKSKRIKKSIRKLRY